MCVSVLCICEIGIGIGIDRMTGFKKNVPTGEQSFYSLWSETPHRGRQHSSAFAKWPLVFSLANGFN